MISIMLVDDHPVVLQGLCLLIEAQAGFRVIGRESDPRKAAREIRRLAPDVLVLDWFMPGMNSAALITQVISQCRETRVVVLSVNADIAYVHEALSHGAHAYVSKSDLGENLVFAVREAAAGRRYLSTQFSQRDIEDYASRSRDVPLDSYSLLSDREQQVLLLASEGKTSSQISETLNISTRTAEKHRANIYRKLDINSQTELVRYALQRGIISIE